GDTAGFQDERTPTPFDLNGVYVKHLFCFLAYGSHPAEVALRDGFPATPPAPRAAIANALRSRLAANAQAADQLLVTLLVPGLDVIEEPPALADEFQQAPARMVVLGMGLEMLGQVG